MSSDVRDLELAERLEAAVAHVAPEPGDRVRSVRRRGSIRRVTRWSAIAAALAVFLGSLGWAAFALRRPTRPTALSPIDTSGWRTYDGLKPWASYLGPKPWAFRYPPSWHLQPYGPAGDCGFLVSNVDHEFRHPKLPNEQTTAWDFRGLPNDLVVIDFHLAGCDLGPLGFPSSTIFPLSLERMRLVTADAHSRFGAPQPYRLARIWDGGSIPITLAAWLGPNASPEDRQVAEVMIGSTPMPIPYADATLELPSGWHGTTIQANRTVALFAATRVDAVTGDSVIKGCTPTGPCFIGSVDALKLGPADAYVQVKGFYLPRLSVTPLPPIRPESFHRSGEWMGAPIMELAGDPAGGGNGHFVITYWMGPQASVQVRSQVVDILSGLHLSEEAAP